jgi:hypothetical protein
MTRTAIALNVRLEYVVYMYSGEMESLGLSSANRFGLDPYTLFLSTIPGSILIPMAFWRAFFTRRINLMGGDSQVRFVPLSFGDMKKTPSPQRIAWAWVSGSYMLLARELKSTTRLEKNQLGEGCGI